MEMTRHTRPSLWAILLGMVLLICATLPLRADPAAMRAALAAAGARDWAGAARLAPAGVGRDVVEWQRLRAGEGLLGEYEAFIARRPDWPAMGFLRQKGEAAAARSTTPARVAAYFGAHRAGTPVGAIAHITALASLGRTTEAEAEARRVWVGMALSAEQEEALIALQGPALALAHEARLDALLWDGRAAEAERMLPRVSAGWQALARARMALRAEKDGVNGLIAAVPADLKADPGLAYERFVWRMRKGMTDGALDLALERSVSATMLGDPGAWARRRAQLARDLLGSGKPREAYRVAALHHLTSGGDYADLEFLAGFIALRKLDDPATALGHFRHLGQGVSTPISLSRALYWQGRAAEALGKADAAKAAYTAAATHQSAYYGLLAAEKLGLSLDPALVKDPGAADWRTTAFASSSVLEAARLLQAAGDRGLAKRFFLHLAAGLPPEQLRPLADLALSLNEPHIAVLIAKQAAGSGVIHPRAYFPVVGFVPDGLAVSRALALSIARRESEFDPAVISPAGARGLMQVMPGTAKMMADKTTQPYALARLTTDPSYNVTLGAAYLAQLVAEFGPSVALVASGYNAGPGRPRRWITEFGDPRLAAVDVVDWVETIPFAETRTYVMRVVESLVIYRARLRGASGPVKVTAELTGR